MSFDHRIALAAALSTLFTGAACTRTAPITAEAGSSATPAPATSAQEAADTSAPAATNVSDVRLAKAALVSVADLPGAEWTAKQQIDEPKPVDFSVDCGSFTKKVTDALVRVNKAPQARSPKFSLPTGTSFEEAVAVFPATADAEKVMAIYLDRAMPKCILKILQGEIARGDAGAVTVLGVPNVIPADVVTEADDTAAFAVGADVEASGQRATVYVALVEVRVGRAVAELQLVSLTAPTDREVKALAKPAVRRLKEQFGG